MGVSTAIMATTIKTATWIDAEAKPRSTRQMDESAAADGELMRRTAAGDEYAARVLVERHLSRAIGLAFRPLGNRSQAEDIAQEAFLRLWK